MFSRARFHSYAADHQQNRFHPLAKICNMSLTLDSSWKYLFWLVSTFHVVFCHAAPSCGTCSRARELPGGPPPLRNEIYPWGFDDLSPDQRARVDAANKIYIGLAKFIEFLILQGIFFAIENPENSLLWLLPIWATVFQHAFFVTFDACVYGGQRKPPKRFSQTAPVLFFMLPLPKSGKRARDDEGDKGRPNPVREDVRERTPKNPKKKAPVRAKVLEGLHGYSGLNKQKTRVCYNYNLPHG